MKIQVILPDTYKNESYQASTVPVLLGKNGAAFTASGPSPQGAVRALAQIIAQELSRQTGVEDWPPKIVVSVPDAYVDNYYVARFSVSLEQTIIIQGREARLDLAGFGDTVDAAVIALAQAAAAELERITK